MCVKIFDIYIKYFFMKYFKGILILLLRKNILNIRNLTIVHTEYCRLSFERQGLTEM